MEIIDTICSAIIFVFGLLTFHKTIYNVIGFFCQAKTYPKTDKLGRYAVVIAARNEEKVVGNLIESIHRQTYPQELLQIFVVADNCHDKTAELCRSLGAVVYERNDTSKARKGYALEFLFEQIDKDYGIESVDGYFVFDADNLLAPDFVEQMNRAFQAGFKIVTSYRNSKNFDTNFISSAYGIHFYHNSLGKHRPRSVLNVGTHLTGTGYLISSKLLAGGWHYTTFTEDDQITMAMSGQGHKIAYCEAAEFFDEQPCDFRTVFNQRVRWAKGRLTNFFKYGYKAFIGIFTHRSFTCYDIFTYYFPYGLFNWAISLLYPLSTFIVGLFHQSGYDYSKMIVTVAASLGSQYLYALFSGLITVIREKKHIRCSPLKLVFYVFTFPWFNMISIPVYIVAIFKRVKWTPIIHDDNRKIDDLIKL